MISLTQESEGYNTVMVAPPYVQPILESFTYSITGLQYTKECQILRAFYVC